MKNKVSRMIREYNMISTGDHVICALSGGKDSMALISILAELQKEQNFLLSAAHFNHQLRGEESYRDESFVSDWCRAHKIALETGSADVAAYAEAHSMGIEEAARFLRYRFLTELDPQAKIATAHTADDNLETLIMHMLRGCGLHGLTGIPPVRGRIIRPLLSSDTSDILRYLEENGVPHIEDSTNAEDSALRNRIRHTVVPLLRAEAPEIACRSWEMCAILTEDDAYLSQSARQFMPAVFSSPDTLELPALISQPIAMQHRILKYFLKDVPEISSGQIAAVLALCKSPSPSAQLSLPGGFQVQRVYQKLQLLSGHDRQTAAKPVETTLLLNQTVSFGHYRISLFSSEYSPEASAQSEITIPIRPSPTGAYTIRVKQSGDRIHLQGGTKKVSRLMIDRKIPAAIRGSVPLLCQGARVVGVLPEVLSDTIIPASGEPCWYLQTEIMEVSHESGY